MQQERLRVKEAPTRVDRMPVIKSTFLGWQSNLVLGQTPGYFAYVITYDTATDGDPSAYHVHLMRAAALDSRWLRIESRHDLFWNEAEAAFAEHDKLAIRPGRS